MPVQLDPRSVIHTITYIRADGNNLSEDDTLTVKLALLAWFTLLEPSHDSREDEVVRRRRLYFFAVFIKETVMQNINQLFIDLKTITSILLKDAGNGRKTTVRSFKGIMCSLGLSPYLKGLLSAEALVEDSRYHADWKHLYGCAKYLSKLPLDAEWLQERELRDYVTNLERVRSWKIDKDDEDVRAINQIIKKWFKDFRLTSFVPRHGPGAVVEGKIAKGWLRKWACMASDSRISALAKYLELRDGIPWTAIIEEYRMPFVQDTPLRKRANARVCKYMTVPKTSLNLRTLSGEPAFLLYCQLGIRDEVVEFIDRSPALSKIIDLTHQSKNQVLARIGSMEIGVVRKYRKDFLKDPKSAFDFNALGNWNCNMVTLDLKRASDSVGWTPTRYFFAGTDLLLWMTATRSTHIMLPEKELMELPIFAGMGSGLCFPVQSIIYAAIIELARKRFRKSLGKDGKDMCPTVRVYGDDLVVPAILARPVIDLLQKFGFITNEDKSFIHGPFRESCGKEYYHGTDVSPLYYRLKAATGEAITAEQYAGLCDAANNAASWGAWPLRKHYLRLLMGSRARLGKKLIPAIPPFSSDVRNASTIWSPNPTNWRLPTRWNSDYQCRQWYRLVAKRRQPVKRTGPLWDRINYSEWLIKRTQKATEDYGTLSPAPRLGMDRKKVIAALAKVGPWSRKTHERLPFTSDCICFVDTKATIAPYGKVELVYAAKWSSLL